MEDLKSALRGQALALPSNIRLGWKGLPGTDTEGYYENSLITTAKVLYHWGLISQNVCLWKPFPVRSQNLRARPEPTQLEHLSGASFLGKLLVLPANVRLDWKVIARYKHSSLFDLIVSDEGKKFYDVETRTLLADVPANGTVSPLQKTYLKF